MPEALGEAVLYLSTDARKLIEGLEAAKRETGGVQKAFDETHKDLLSKFGQKFRHIGIDTFGDQMLATAGVTGKTRAIMSTLQMGVEHLGATFGIAAGPVGLIVGAMAAVAAIGFKVYQSNQKNAESLDQLTKKQQENLQTTRDLATSLKEYDKHVTGLPPSLEALRIATLELDRVQRQQLSSSEGQRMAAAQMQMDNLRKSIDKTKDSLAGAERYRDSMLPDNPRFEAAQAMVNSYRQKITELGQELVKENQTYALSKANVDALRDGYTGAKDQITKLTAAMEESKKGIMEYGPPLKAFLDGQAKARAETEKLKNALISLATSTASSMGSLSAQLVRGKMSFTSFVDHAVRELAILAAQMAATAAFGPIGGAFAGSFAGGLFRAEGGPVSSGQSYIVGERGPELFIPDRSGSIVPNDKIPTGGGVTVNQNFNFSGMDFSSADAARRIAAGIAAQMRSGAIEALALMRATADQSTLQPGRAY